MLCLVHGVKGLHNKLFEKTREIYFKKVANETEESVPSTASPVQQLDENGQPVNNAPINVESERHRVIIANIIATFFLDLLKRLKQNCKKKIRWFNSRLIPVSTYYSTDC